MNDTGVRLYGCKRLGFWGDCKIRREKSDELNEKAALL